MYLRFQTKVQDSHSGRPVGFLVAAHQLRDSNTLKRSDEECLQKWLAHFNMHMKIPPCYKDPSCRRGISWFKDSSSLIPRVWDIVYFLEDHDVFIDIIKTDDPGVIYYEDGHQVVAKSQTKLQKS